MASKEIVNSNKTVESVVNRWLVDYYVFLALEFFQKEKHADFCGIRDVLSRVLDRPLQTTDATPTKILVLQFLTRIHEGESIDVAFESDLSISPLESALMLLGKIAQECSVPQQDFENVCTVLKEMIVGIFIKNNEFDKAKAVLNRHFPKPMIGKKAIFMGLIRHKSNTHEAIEQIDFKRFKEQMLAFCYRLCPFNVPFLHKAAKQLVEEKLAWPHDKAAGPGDGQAEPSPSSSPQTNSVQFAACKRTVIQRTRLEAAYKALSAGSDGRTFAQLEEEVEVEEQARKQGTSRDSEQDGLFQRDSGSPMEASPADQPPQTNAVPQTQAGSLSKTPTVRNRRLYTVARLVVEPDSQGRSQCTTASEELEAEVRTEEPPQSTPAIPNNKDLQNPVTDNTLTIPTTKRPRRADKMCSGASTSLAELPADSEEEPSGSEKIHNRSNSSLRNSTKSKHLSSDSEEDPPAPCRTSDPPSKDPDNTDDICIPDSPLDRSPSVHRLNPQPQTSSTPHKDSVHNKGPSRSKWKQLFNNAKESNDTWSDEESYFAARTKRVSHNESTLPHSGHRKRMWTESETQKLKEGVKKYGEGNWSKIKACYTFNDRTTVNLKDRWRTMRKLKMV